MNAKFDENTLEPAKRGLLARLRGNFLTGLVFIAPVVLTGYFAWWAVNFIDSKAKPFIPSRFDPNNIWNIPERIGFEIPGVGVIFFLIATTIIGSLTKGLLGRTVMRWVSATIYSFPIVRSVYGALKQIIETVFSNREQSFQQACVVEYPRKGIYAIGFIARAAGGEINAKHQGKDLLAVFVPTTPNPTSGFFLYFPKKDVTILDMSVEEAAKLIISAGLVEPEQLPTVS